MTYPGTFLANKKGWNSSKTENQRDRLSIYI